MKYYCLFHTSGFRTYRINGEENEALSEEKKVTDDCPQEYPSAAEPYMNKPGAGFLFQYINESTITLVVNEIDSIKQDTAGNPIKCAFQVIANADEKEQVGKLAAKIKSDLKSFNAFYSDLFSMRGGLHIEGSKLMDYIEEAMKCDVEPIEPKPFEEPKPSNPSVSIPYSAPEDSFPFEKKKSLIIAMIIAIVVVLFVIILKSGSEG